MYNSTRMALCALVLCLFSVAPSVFAQGGTGQLNAMKAGRLQRGDNVVMCASGGGLNMACAAFRW